MKHFRKLLFPFAGLYYLATTARNTLYDNEIKTSENYDIPIICVGNLSVGGTGKSPMTEYLIRLLKDTLKIATLSRGYGRNTKGYIKVTSDSIATRVGDEPLQFATKFPDINIAVCEDRRTGINRLLATEKLDAIILDDAYQHRSVQADFNILLTSYEEPFFHDYLLPAGNLRESRYGANRAQIIVVTKCPVDISLSQMDRIKSKILKYSSSPVFFASIVYDTYVYGSNTKLLTELKNTTLTLVTGIANPLPFLQHLDNLSITYKHISYGDHHNFTSKDVNKLKSEKIILTTEKDYMRLKDRLDGLTLYYLPIQTEILNGQKKEFDKFIYKATGIN